MKELKENKIYRYAKEAEKIYGHTAEYREFEEKSKGRKKEENEALGAEMMRLFVQFGQMKDKNLADERVQEQVRKLQCYITEHFYTCSDQILYSLGNMYAANGEFTANIDEAGGVGTAEFVCRAIEVYCKNTGSL